MKIKSKKLLAGRNVIIYTKHHYFGAEWQFCRMFKYFRIYRWTKRGMLPRYRDVFKTNDVVLKEN